jgi:DNA repair protein RadC
MADQLPLFAAPGALPASPVPRPYAVPIYTVMLVRERQLPWPRSQLRQAADAATLLRAYLRGVDREHFVVVLLDRKNRVIGLNTVSVGSLTASLAHPREVMKPAILANAAALICGHNHPSGDPQPSEEDRVITTRLVEAGKLLGIGVLDHLIVGDGTTAYYSFADAGAFEEPPRCCILTRWPTG